MPPSEVVSRVSDSTLREYLIWHLVARALGRGISTLGICTDADSASIFSQGFVSPEDDFFDPDFSAKCPGTVEMILSLATMSKGSWKVVSSKPPAGPAVFVLSSLLDRRAQADTCSLVSFINAIGIVDVKRSRDGIHRRGLVAKK